MTVFANLVRAASVKIDAIYGEPFDFRPMVMLGGRLIDDADRECAQGFTACFATDAEVMDPVSQRNASVAGKGLVHGGVSSGKAIIEFDISALTSTPRARDRFIRQADGAVFEVTGVLADDLPRFGVRVVKL